MKAFGFGYFMTKLKAISQFNVLIKKQQHKTGLSTQNERKDQLQHLSGTEFDIALAWINWKSRTILWNKRVSVCVCRLYKVDIHLKKNSPKCILRTFQHHLCEKSFVRWGSVLSSLPEKQNIFVREKRSTCVVYDVHL